MYAIEQIISGNKKIYAEQGEQLEVVNDQHTPVMICKNAKGALIPVHQKYLSERKIK
jgi:hypothetical protein